MPDYQNLQVGYVVKRFPRFSETFILNEILALQELGVVVHVFSLRKPGPEPVHASLARFRGEVHYLPGSSTLKHMAIGGRDNKESSLSDLLKGSGWSNEGVWSGKTQSEVAALQLQAVALASLGRRLRLTHLHAHFASDPTTVAMLASELGSIPYSFTAHAKDIFHCYTTQERDNAARREKITRAKFVATVTDFNRDHLVRIAPAAAHKIRRIYNGIDLTQFRDDQVSSKFAKHKIPLVLGIGRLVEKKGFEYLVWSCQELKRRNIGFRCEIIGGGPQSDHLSNLIKQAGIEDCLSLVPPQPQEQLIESLLRADITVLPCVVTESGDRDALPTVLLESLAMGIPIITTTVNGCPEIVGNEEAGLLVEPHDYLGLANAMESLVLAPSVRHRLGRQARQRCQQLFDLRVNVKKLAAGFERAHNPTSAGVSA